MSNQLHHLHMWWALEVLPLPPLPLLLRQRFYKPPGDSARVQARWQEDAISPSRGRDLARRMSVCETFV